MKQINPKQLVTIYQKNPQEAYDLIKDYKKINQAAILIDLGSDVKEIEPIKKGEDILNELLKEKKELTNYHYFIGNAECIKASIQYGEDNFSIKKNQALLKARKHFYKFILNKKSNDLYKSFAITNFGNILQSTGRYIEALDFYDKASQIYPKNITVIICKFNILTKLYCNIRCEIDYYDQFIDYRCLIKQIIQLYKTIEQNYETIAKIHTEIEVNNIKSYVEKTKKTFEEFDSQKNEIKPIKKTYLQSYLTFIYYNNLALSLFFPVEDYNDKIDTLTFISLQNKKDSIIKIIAMLNQMKCDYAFARQIFYESKNKEYFLNTVNCIDTLDYTLYNPQISAIIAAQRIIFDILDKIAVALSFYCEFKNDSKENTFSLDKAKKEDFKTFWYNRNQKILKEDIQKEIERGNKGLLALYHLHIDTQNRKNEYDDSGIFSVYSKYRNASTHRFVKIHDNIFNNDGECNNQNDLIETVSFSKFKEITLESFHLVKGALFYFCDAINFYDKNKHFHLPIPLNLPNHDDVRN